MSEFYTWIYVLSFFYLVNFAFDTDRTSAASNKSPDSDEDETDLSLVWIIVGVGAARLLVLLLGWAIYFIVQKNKKSQTNGETRGDEWNLAYFSDHIISIKKMLYILLETYLKFAGLALGEN